MKSFKEILESYKSDTKKADTLHKSLSNHYNNYSTTDHINDYANGHAYDINDHLWSVHRKNEKFHNFGTINGLDKNMKEHKTPHDFHVYSGTAHDPRLHKDSSHIVHHPAYMSTSLHPNIARLFSTINKDKKRNAHVLKIHVPKGHPGAYIGHISFYSKQKEFVLPRGSNLRHIKTEKKNHITMYNHDYQLGRFSHKNNNKHSYFLHHMELI